MRTIAIDDPVAPVPVSHARGCAKTAELIDVLFGVETLILHDSSEVKAIIVYITFRCCNILGCISCIRCSLLLPMSARCLSVCHAGSFGAVFAK